MIGQSSELEMLLQKVAQEIILTDDPFAKELALAVLRRRLLLLLKAGQALRQEKLKDKKAGAEWSICVHERRWDTALKAAKEQK